MKPFLRSLPVIFLMTFTFEAGAQSATVQATGDVQVQKERKGRQVITANKVTLGDDGEEHTIEIRVEDGKVYVTRDGVVVPDAELQTENGRIIITDDNGNRIHTIATEIAQGRYTVLFDHNAETPKVMIGLHMAEPDPSLLYHLGLEKGKATMIAGVYEGLPAYKAGLAEYDIITAIDDEVASNADVVSKHLASKEPGEVVTMSVIQKGKPHTVEVTVVKYDPKAFSEAKLLGAARQDQWITLFEGDNLLRERAALELMRSPLYVAPNRYDFRGSEFPKLEERIERLNAQMQELNAAPPGLNERLQQLDARMQELEQLLQKLIEQNNTR